MVQKQSSAKRASIIAMTAALYVVFFFLSYSVTLPNFTLLYLPIILLGVFPMWFGWSGLIGAMIGGFIGGAFVEGLGFLGIFESVVALLFSPEQVLREEAALLIARTEKDLYWKTADRIPGAVRSQLDRINAGESQEKEYVYEKVKFLSSCFDGIKEDDLLFLAEKMLFVGNNEGGIYSQPSNTILWSFSENKPDPDVFVNHEDISDPARIIKDIRTTYSYCYVLPLKAVWEFNFLYPEKSFGIFRYIDKYEG